MKTAKIIRHRHKIIHSINGENRSIYIDDHFKAVFSHPLEEDDFQRWMKKNNGFYKWDKELNKVSPESKIPDLDVFKDKGDCYCDVITFFLLVVAGYEYHSSLAPYKGEVYVKA